MCNKQLHLSSITDSIPVDNKILQTFVDEGILTIENNILRITENGLPFIRNVAAVFDPLLRNSAKTFSKAV
jgi:oxygen-independent coproporphyrinogen-3 oxidase